MHTFPCRAKECPNTVSVSGHVDASGVNRAYCPDCTEGPWCEEHMPAAKKDHGCKKAGRAAASLAASTAEHARELARLEERLALAQRAIQGEIDTHQAAIAANEERLASVTSWAAAE